MALVQLFNLLYFLELNYGWEYKHATVKPVNNIPNIPKIRRYEYTIERPAPPPPAPPPFTAPPPFPPPPVDEDPVATEFFGPEYEEGDESTLSTRESDVSVKKDEKKKNSKKISSIKRPASCG